MKKVFLLAGCLSLLAVGIIGVSCKKDEAKEEPKEEAKKEWKGCICTLEYDGERETHTFTAAELKEEGLNSCAETQRELREWADADRVTCTDL